MASDFFLLCGIAVAFALALIDIRKLILPDALTAMLGATGFLYHLSSNWIVVSPLEAASGAVIGSSALYLVGYTYARARKRAGLGYGDIKFMVAAGVWIGIWQIPLLIAIASLSTLSCVLILAAANRLEPPTAIRPIPFGPGLSGALIILLMHAHAQMIWG